ncbi:HutD family protein [Castellaniella sp.]|uniref:HutD family protein n=1 Tax=Castellaniella sp. TaxID=1955812 RepID=UPI003566187B
MTDAVHLIPATSAAGGPWGGAHAQARTIASQARNDGSDSVLWRALDLDIDGDGACPTADGLDCILMLVEGGPLHWVKKRTAQTTRLDAGSRLYFAAEAPCAVQAVEAPARLFLLQLLRKQAHGCVDLRSRAQNLPMRAGETLLHCARGRCQLRLPAHLGGPRELQAGDTLRITLAREPAFVLPFEPGDDRSRLIDARIHRY